MSTCTHDSPVGPLTLVADGDRLVGCYFSNHPLAIDHELGRDPVPRAPNAVLDRTRRELDDFFAGRLERFTVAVNPPGTDFQRRVWGALRKIPYAQTVSYGHIAKQIASPAAARAVGAANGKNPICIVIPCHRVIGASGSLTGFGGGLDRKRFLLALERGGPRYREIATLISP